jgi:hypothetical protein
MSEAVQFESLKDNWEQAAEFKNTKLNHQHLRTLPNESRGHSNETFLSSAHETTNSIYRGPQSQIESTSRLASGGSSWEYSRGKIRAPKWRPKRPATAGKTPDGNAHAFLRGINSGADEQASRSQKGCIWGYQRVPSRTPKNRSRQAYSDDGANKNGHPVTVVVTVSDFCTGLWVPGAGVKICSEVGVVLVSSTTEAHTGEARMAFQIAREAKLHVVANKPRYSKDKKTIVIKPSYGNFGHDDIITVAMELKPVDISPSLVVQVTEPDPTRDPFEQTEELGGDGLSQGGGWALHDVQLQVFGAPPKTPVLKHDTPGMSKLVGSPNKAQRGGFGADGGADEGEGKGGGAGLQRGDGDSAGIGIGMPLIGGRALLGTARTSSKGSAAWGLHLRQAQQVLAPTPHSVCYYNYTTINMLP